MNKLNNPIVILALIILSIGNLLLSISILVKINKENDIVENVGSNMEQSNQAETTEPNTQAKKENLYFTIYNTFGDKYKDNWQTTIKYDYSVSKEQNYSNRWRDAQSYCVPMYTVSCNDEQCHISFYSRDSRDNPGSEFKLYNADVSKTIIDKVKHQEEITPDMIIDENETAKGQIVMAFKDLPPFIIIIKDRGYYIDNALLNYINSLR